MRSWATAGNRQIVCPQRVPDVLRMKASLSEAFVKAQPSSTQRQEITDTRCRGLVLRTTPSGKRTWSFRFRDFEGRTQRVSLGSYPDVSLADARKAADGHRRSLQFGTNPIEAKRASARAKNELTEFAFETLADRYLNKYARRFKKSAAEDERMLRLHVIPSWKGRDFRRIKRSECIALLENIADRGNGPLANRLRSLLSKLFRFALDRGELDTSPAVALPKLSPDKPRDRVLSDEEIRLIWKAALKGSPFSRTVGCAILLILVTGVRPGEAAAMHAQELSLGTGLWIIPSARTKSGKQHIVPLSEFAFSVFAGVSTERGYVFASPISENNTAAIDAHALARAMARFAMALKRKNHPLANFPGAASWTLDPPRPHDLRRTVATRLRSLGVSPFDVQAVLGHSRRDTLGIHYDKYDSLQEKRKALSLWGTNLSRLLSHETGEETSRFPSVRRSS